MYSIKEETDKNICYGCLSTDRQLTLLKNHVALFYNLLEDQQVFDTKIVLCWECRTFLNKIQMFQNRIQQAQYILQQSFCSLNTSCEPLSTLSTMHKDYFDFTLEYVYVDDKTKEFDKQPETVELTIDVERLVNSNVTVDNHFEKSEGLVKSNNYDKNVEKVKKIRRKYKNNEESENSYEDDEKFNRTVEESNVNLTNYEKSGISNEISNTDDDSPRKVYKKLKEYAISDIDIKQESDDEFYSDFKVEDDNYTTDEKDCEETIKKDFDQREEKRILSLKKYFDNVNVTDSDIDLNNLKKYCNRVKLNDKEIDELLERDLQEIRPGMRRNRPYECKDCDKAYKKEVDYKRHVTFNHMDRTGRFKCKYCKKALSSWASLEKHWEKHNYHYRCSLCGWTTRPYSGIIHHVEAFHSKIYTCVKCNKQLSNMREFKRHFKETHERIICDDCGKSFIKKRSLETHIRRHHLPPTCQICNRTYASYHNLENHYRLNHPEMVRGINDKKELAYCVECNKQFPSVYKYRRHLSNAAIHTPPKIESVPCPECGKVFSRKIRMTNHVLAVHRKTTKHRCDICNKTFCSAYSAKTHRQCVHEKIPMPKNKFCDICGRGFSTNRILANHRRTHTGERPYPCPHCPATFAQRTAMKTHAKTQHKNLIIIN